MLPKSLVVIISKVNNDLPQNGYLKIAAVCERALNIGVYKRTSDGESKTGLNEC